MQGYDSAQDDDITVGPDGTAKLGRLASLLRDKRIPFEMCPSSNVQTGAVGSIAENPFDRLARLRFASPSTPTTG